MIKFIPTYANEIKAGDQILVEAQNEGGGGYRVVEVREVTIRDYGLGTLIYVNDVKGPISYEMGSCHDQAMKLIEV